MHGHSSGAMSNNVNFKISKGIEDVGDWWMRWNVNMNRRWDQEIMGSLK